MYKIKRTTDNQNNQDMKRHNNVAHTVTKKSYESGEKLRFVFVHFSVWRKTIKH